MSNLLTCKTCGVTQIPETWFGQCKRCYDLPDEVGYCACPDCDTENPDIYKDGYCEECYEECRQEDN